MIRRPIGISARRRAFFAPACGQVWNAGDSNANMTLSSGNAQATASTTAWKSARCTVGRANGCRFFEITVPANQNVYIIVGVGSAGATLNSYVGSSTEGMGYNCDGRKFYNGSATSYGATWNANGDIVEVVVDFAKKELTFYKLGSAQGVAYSAWSMGPRLYPMISIYGASLSVIANIGQAPFAFVPPGCQPWGED